MEKDDTIELDLLLLADCIINRSVLLHSLWTKMTTLRCLLRTRMNTSSSSKHSALKKTVELLDKGKEHPLRRIDLSAYIVRNAILRFASHFRFPRTLPFSKVVPYCCEDIRQFVGKFYRFVEGFNQEQNEMDELVKEVKSKSCWDCESSTSIPRRIPEINWQNISSVLCKI